MDYGGDMAKAEVITLHGPIRETRRTLKSGAKRAKAWIEVDATPVVHVFDDRRLGKGPAEAIKSLLGDLLIKRSGGDIAETTKQTRRYQLEAYRKGKPWAVKRFRSARIKNTPPKAGNVEKSWMFSGRTARGLAVQEDRDKQTWRINVPANRLSRDTAQNEGEYSRLVQSLNAKLPELGNPALLLNHPKVQKAVASSIAGLLAVAQDQREALRLARSMALVDLLPGTLAPYLARMLVQHRAKRVRR